jgi:hypothetical protein
MKVYGDKISEKVKAKFDKAVAALNEAIPSDDTEEIGDAVRLVEKIYKKIGDQIM